jgi:hypothetical protein
MRISIEREGAIAVFLLMAFLFISYSQSSANIIGIICNTYTAVDYFLFGFSIVLILIGGAIYASSHITEGTTKLIEQNYGAAMILGGVVGILLAILSPYLVSILSGSSTTTSVCAGYLAQGSTTTAFTTTTISPSTTTIPSSSSTSVSTITTTTSIPTTSSTTTMLTSTSSTTTIPQTAIYCGESAGQFTNGPHGLYVLSDFGYLGASVYGAQNWGSMLQYILPDPTDCGITIAVPWSRIEPSNGTYNWTYINDSAAPWIAAGKQVNLVIEGAAETPVHEYQGQLDTPSWILNDGVTIIPGSDCDGVVQPVYWEGGYIDQFDKFVIMVDKHYANNPNIGYIRFGFSSGGEDDLRSNSTQCYNDWLNAGYSTAVWQSYIVGQIAYLGSMHLPKLFFADLSPQISSQEAAASVGSGDGLAYFGLRASDVMAYARGQACSDNWCNIFQQYKGQVPFIMQPAALSDPTNASGGEGSMTYILPFAIDQMGVKAFELNPDEFYVQDNPSYSPYAQYHSDYKCVFQTAANALVPIPNSITMFNCPPV